MRQFSRINCAQNNITSKFYSEGVKFLRLPEENSCSQIDLFKFTANLRPWNCQVHIQILPVEQDFISIKYPVVFYYKNWKHSRNFELNQPSKVPNINILITKKYVQSEFERWQNKRFFKTERCFSGISKISNWV